MSDLDKNIAKHVATTGWFVIGVAREDEGPAFSYSIGLQKSYGHPEIIIAGLSIELMHQMINGIGERVKSGEKFTEGRRYAGLLEGHDCFFAKVPSSAYDDYLCQAVNYYKGKPVRALQCIWPDARGGQFPSDPDCPEYVRDSQNLERQAESHGHNFSLAEWPFKDPHNVASFTTTKVMRENYPILLVTHDEEDGGWQLLCGTTNSSKDAMLVCLGCLFEKDRSIGQLADLPIGWLATRSSVNSPWIREKNVRSDE